MKTKIAVAAFFICLGSASVFCASTNDAMVDAQLAMPHKVDSSASDGKAVVYALEGKAMLTPKGSPIARELKMGDLIQVGDAVYTEKGTTLSISFDKQRNNAVRIPADSKATFTSIEPTDIKLENGSIYSVVNGLVEGSTWKVTTPSAVAAVRGTVFLVRYESATGQMYVATVDVPDDGKNSAIEIQSLTGEGRTEVIEGKEISMKEGEATSAEMVQDLSVEAIAEVQAFFEQVSAESAELEKSTEGENDQSTDGESDKEKEDSSSGEGESDQTSDGESDQEKDTSASDAGDVTTTGDSGDTGGSLGDGFGIADDLSTSGDGFGTDDGLPVITQEDASNTTTSGGSGVEKCSGTTCDSAGNVIHSSGG